MPADVRLTMWKSGAYSLTSAGEDGSRNVLWVYPDGGVTTDEQAADGSRRVSFKTAVKDGVSYRILLEAGNWTPTYDATLRSELDGPWTVGPPIDKVLPDGTRVHITREGDGTGHFWEHGTRTAGLDADGYEIPARDWTRVFHPYGDTQHGGQANQRESSEWGTKTRANGDRITYSGLKVTTRDGSGAERTVWERGEFNPRTGEQSRGVTVDNPDRTHSTTWSSTRPDGSWTITTTTTDGNGDGTVHTTWGQGDQIKGDSTDDVHIDPDDGGEDDPHDSTTQPAGDGEGASEGNPDGPHFDSVTLRHLLGSSWVDHDGLDTLGDVEARLRPWRDRIAAAAASGAGGHNEGLLDTLGAPPDIFFDLTGAGHDATEDLDSLGRPHPFFQTPIEQYAITTAAAAAGHGGGSGVVLTGAHAVPLGTLQVLARDFASSASVAGSVVVGPG